MRVLPVKFNQKMARSLEKFSDQGGEKIANYINAAGKFAIAPLMILYNPFTKESKENKKWAAIKQPVEAVISILAQLASLNVLYKVVDKFAQKGKLKFKIVEDAIKDHSKIPASIMQTTGNNVEKALKLLDETCVGIVKDRLGTMLTIAMFVPVLALSNRLFPKIADLLVKDDKDD